MQELLSGLASLSGLRNRGDMDFALVKLIGNTRPWQITSTQLMSAVGPLDDQRWLSRARLTAAQTKPERDVVWSDWRTLPKLADFPHREAAIMTEGVIHTGSRPYTTIFPIETQQAICSLLEVESSEPIPAQAEKQIESLLWIYQNLQGLLDYGEKDSLTELLNRKSFDGAFLRAAIEQNSISENAGPDRRVHHAGASYWLALIDIDHFKRVNDNFGHLIGDEVLLLMAGLMRANFRFHDQIYRFGGEEFVVLMRCADHAVAASALERFRHKVEEHVFPQVGTITVSVGFAALRSDDTPSSAFDRADKAVYYAKAHGRNQVCSYAELVKAGELTEQVDDSSEADYF
jgi:diguanylate cyclase (GGDEF)-like protein